MRARSSCVGATGPTSTPCMIAASTSGLSDAACTALFSGPKRVGGIRRARFEVARTTGRA